MTYTESGVSLLMLADDASTPPIQWIFVKPLVKEVCLTTACLVFFTGFVFWKMERSINPVLQRSSVTQFSTAPYFAFSALTFAYGRNLCRRRIQSLKGRVPLAFYRPIGFSPVKTIGSLLLHGDCC